MKERVRIAIVGCGAIAHWHLDAVDRAGVPISVAAAIDPVAEHARRIAARTGATPYESLDAALDAGGFEAALIAVPHHRHEAIASAALRAGLHVLLEKPLAPTVDACERMLDTARAAGTVFMVAEERAVLAGGVDSSSIAARRRDRRRRDGPCRDILPRARGLLRR